MDYNGWRTEADKKGQQKKKKRGLTGVGGQLRLRKNTFLVQLKCKMVALYFEEGSGT